MNTPFNSWRKGEAFYWHQQNVEYEELHCKLWAQQYARMKEQQLWESLQKPRTTMKPLTDEEARQQIATLLQTTLG